MYIYIHTNAHKAVKKSCFGDRCILTHFSYIQVLFSMCLMLRSFLWPFGPTLNSWAWSLLILGASFFFFHPKDWSGFWTVLQSAFHWLDPFLILQPVNEKYPAMSPQIQIHIDPFIIIACYAIPWSLHHLILTTMCYTTNSNKNTSSYWWIYSQSPKHLLFIES